jgi:hypothetical protein
MTNLKALLAETLEICEKATSGTWGSHMLGGGKGGANDYSIRIEEFQNAKADFAIARVHGRSTLARENAHFIAHSRTALPKLAKALMVAVEALDCYKTGMRAADALSDIAAILEAGEK